MSELLVKPTNDNEFHNITPESAGWSYVGFSARNMKKDTSLSGEGDENEYCFVLISGSCSFSAGGIDFGHFEGRNDVFDKVPPYALYVPFKTPWSIHASRDCEIAICRAPGITGEHPARIIYPDDMSHEVRGTGTNTRHVCNILPEDAPADSLLVVEVITPAGNWSSYPPHKHDTDNLPEESYLEETYYHKINPSQGYVLHRVYTDDRALDEVMAAEHNDVVLVPRGYHPVGAPHGYESYYLNVMAGPKRIWKFKNDPHHEWMLD